MPLAFPSHQGLLAPLWRAWPRRFSVLPLWAGALAPDVIDGAASVVRRVPLGQWIGHSLVGATILGVPVALALATVARAAARRGADGRLRRVAAWLLAVEAGDARFRVHAWSAWVGSISHVLFDVASHARSRLLWPFAEDPAWLGEGWRTVWARVSVPGYPDYPIGPHFAGWVALSVAGAVMFLRFAPRPRRREGATACDTGS